MRFRIFLLVALFLFAFSFHGSSSFAQDVTVPMPEEYAEPDAAPAPEPLPDPAATLQDDGSTVAVPIPGGGEIEVDGPASESPAGIGPIENWSTLRTNPSSLGTGPLGPIPPPQ